MRFQKTPLVFAGFLFIFLLTSFVSAGADPIPSEVNLTEEHGVRLGFGISAWIRT